MFWDLWVWCFLVVGVVYFLIFWYCEVVIGFGCGGFVAFGLGFLFGFVWFDVGCFRLCFWVVCFWVWFVLRWVNACCLCLVCWFGVVLFGGFLLVWVCVFEVLG